MNNAECPGRDGAAATRPPACHRPLLLVWVLLLAALAPARAQWVAFNDHYQGKGSSNNATFWNVYTNLSGAPGNSGPLKNITNGAALPVTLTITNQDLPPGIPQAASPAVGTPANITFSKWVDWGVGSNYWSSIVLKTNSVVAHVFTGLRTDRLYSLKATAMRGAGLANSWVLCRLEGASQLRRAHSAQVQTTTQVPALATNEAILNSGANNLTGDLFDWEDILPADGTLVLYSFKYAGTVFNGSSSHSNAFAPVALRLEERPAVALTITSQPRDATVCGGAPVSFSVTVSGTPPYTYQWRKVVLGVTTNVIQDATDATYTIPSTSADDQASYQVAVTTSVNSVTSRLAALTVQTTPVEVTTQPEDVTAALGYPAAFSAAVNADAAKPVSFQWYQNGDSNSLTGTAIARATNSSFTIGAVDPTNSPFYYLVASNCLSAATSRVASLSLYYEALVITNQPADQTVAVSGAATFKAGVSGSLPQYQWFKGSVALADQTNASLVLSGIQVTQAGRYHCIATNPVGSVTTREAALAVNLPPYDLIVFKSGTAGAVQNSFWKCSQDGADLGTAWRAPDYDDSGWPSGRGGLGVEDNVAVTPWRQTALSLTGTNGSANWTYYFRTTFVFTNDLTELLALYTTNLFDDGMVVYLNGQEAYRYNMPEGPIHYDTPAAATVGTVAPLIEGTLFVTNLPPSLLVQGSNCLAVEVHQIFTNSADIVMGLGVTVVFRPYAALQITNQPSDLTIQESHPAAFSVGYVGSPAYFQWFKWTGEAAEPIPGATSPSFTIPSAAAGADDGCYFVTLSNLINFVVSSNACLQVVADTIPPSLVAADGTLDDATILISFSEPILLYDPAHPEASPTNLLNFSVTNTFGEELAVLSAVFTNGTSVILTTASPRQPQANYIVTVRSAVDASPSHNVAMNMAVPVTAWQTLIDLGDSYEFVQPVAGLDPLDDLENGAWRLPGYDPSAGGLSWYYPAWSLFRLPGPTQYPVPTGTVLSQGGLPSCYFRKTFSGDLGRQGLRLFWRSLVDDGAAFYLNGAELFRTNLPTGPLSVNSLASAASSANQLSPWSEIPATWLQPGANLMAVELHVSDLYDTDMALAMELRAQADSVAIGKVVITSPPADLTVAENTTATFSFRGVAGTSFQWLSNDIPLAGATNAAYTIPWTPPSASGARYRVVVTGPIDSVESSEALLTVLPDTNAPVLVSAYLIDSNTVVATFSEPITQSSAANRLNYALTNATGPNLTVVSAALTNSTNVIIRFDASQLGALTLVVSYIRDTAFHGNTMIPNSRVTVGLRDWALISFDSTAPEGLWRYNQSDIDLGTAWRLPAYSDQSAGWQPGNSVFDWRNASAGGPRATVSGLTVGTQLNGLGSAGNTIPTVYFRKWVNVPLISPDATLTMRHLIDDGAVWYVNAVRLDSFNMDLPTYFTAYANAAPDTAVTLGPFSYDASSMVAGTNLIAVEVHNASATSPDITFGAELLLNVPSLMLPAGGATNEPAPQPPLLSIARPAGSGGWLWWTNPGPYILESAPTLDPAGAPWAPVSDQSNPYLVPSTNTTRFYRLRY